jgi:hypothetical protein
MDIAQHLQKESRDELLGRWRNAIRVLADKSRRALHPQAHDMVSLIEQEWGRRAAFYRPEEWFPWPSTEATPSAGSGIDLTGVPGTGMLKTMGYQVGGTAGKATRMRRLILRRLFEGHLPPVHSPQYMREWGDAGSPYRLHKLAQTIAVLAINEKRRRTANLAIAIQQREADLDFLYDEYYVHKFDFGWPRTDT